MLVSDLVPGEPAICVTCGNTINLGYDLTHDDYICYAQTERVDEVCMICPSCHNPPSLTQEELRDYWSNYVEELYYLSGYWNENSLDILSQTSESDEEEQ